LKWSFRCAVIFTIFLFLNILIFQSEIFSSSNNSQSTNKILITKSKYNELIQQLELNKKLLNELSDKTKELNLSEQQQLSQQQIISSQPAPALQIQFEQSKKNEQQVIEQKVSDNIEKWQTQIQRLNDDYQSLKNKTIELLKNSAEEKRKFLALENEYNEFKEKYGQLNDRIQKLTGQFNELLKVQALKTQQNTELQQKLDKAIQENLLLTAKLEDYDKLKNTNLELTREKNELQNKYQTMFASTQKLINDYAQLKNQYYAILQKLENTQQLQVEKLDSAEKQKLLDNIEALKKERETLVAKISETEKNNIQLVNKHNEALNKIAALINENKTLLANNQELTTALNNFKNQKPQTLEIPNVNEIVQKKIDETYNTLKVENSQLKTINHQLTQKLADLQKQNIDYSQQILTLKNDLEKIQTNNIELTKKITEADRNYLRRIADYELALKNLELKLQSESGKLTANEQQSKQLIEKSKTETDRTEVELKNKQMTELLLKFAVEKKQMEEAHNLRAESLTKKIEELANANKILEKTNQTLQSANAELTKQINELTKTQQELTLTIQTQNSTATKKNMQSENQLLSDIYQKLSTQLIDLTKAHNLLAQKNIELERRNILIEVEYNNLTNKFGVYKNLLTTLNDRLKNSNDDNEKLKNQIAALNDKIKQISIPQSINIELQESAKKIDRLTNDLNEVLAKNKILNQTIEELNSQLKTMSDKYSMQQQLLITQLKAKDEEYSTLKKKYDEMSKEKLTIADNFKKEEAAQLSKENDELKNRIKILTDKLAQAYKEYSQKNESFKELNLLIEKLATENFNLKNTIANLNNQLTELNQKNAVVDKITNDYNKLKSDYDKLKTDYVTLEKELIKAKSEFENLKMENVKLSETLDNIQLVGTFAVNNELNEKLKNQEKYIQELEQRLKSLETKTIVQQEPQITLRDIINLPSSNLPLALQQQQQIARSGDVQLQQPINIQQTSEYEKLLSDYNKAQAELSRANALISEYRRQIEELTRNNQFIQTELSSLKNQVISLTREMEIARSEKMQFYNRNFQQMPQQFYPQQSFQYSQNVPPQYVDSRRFSQIPQSGRILQPPADYYTDYQQQYYYNPALPQYPPNIQAPSRQNIVDDELLEILKQEQQSKKTSEKKQTADQQKRKTDKKNVSEFEEQDNLPKIKTPRNFRVQDIDETFEEEKPQSSQRGRQSAKSQKEDELLDIDNYQEESYSAPQRAKTSTAPQRSRVSRIKLKYLSNITIPDLKSTAELYFLDDAIVRVSSKTNGQIKLINTTGSVILNKNIKNINNWIEGIAYSHKTNEYYLVDWSDKNIKITNDNFEPKSEIKLPKYIEPNGIEVLENGRIFITTRDGKLIEITYSGKVLREINLSEKVNFKFSPKGIAAIDNILIIGSSEYGANPGTLLFLDNNNFSVLNMIDIYSNFDLPFDLNFKFGFSGLTIDKQNSILYFCLRNQPQLFLYRIEY